MTHTFLLEIGLEEMPANIIRSAEKQLIEKTKEFLNKYHLNYSNVQGFSTPRRFSVIVKDLDDKQPDENLIVRGPAKKIAQDEKGNWTKAAIGFSKSQGGTVEDLIVKNDDGKPYVFIEKFIPGSESKKILEEMTEVIKKIEFPKSMKWGNTNYHYARPIHWILSLLGNQVIPMEVFNIESSKMTMGHRFLGEEIKINHPKEYEEKLKRQYVIVDRQKRQDLIINQINAICKKNNWTVPNLYSDLLNEVTDLVEYPTAFYGSFEESYLEIPNVVLETSMIDHQRYFSVWSKDKSKLLPYFISVRNGNDNHIKVVAKGNEKVLSARLADAKFFYEEDKKLSIKDYIEKLKILDYHKDIGTVYEKQLRVNKMTQYLNEFFKLTVDDEKDLKRASSIYKFDLVTQMVDEFTSLQGEIGALYAKERGESEGVSKAIREHYLPTSAKGKLPESKTAKLLAITDKLDSLIQFFSINLIPTGSNDPYALRRKAMGMVRIILDFDLSEFDLLAFLNKMIEVSEIPVDRMKKLEENENILVSFILNRLDKIMKNQYNISYDIRQAVLGTKDKDIIQILRNSIVLEEAKDKEGFKEFINSITRVLNITNKYESTDEFSMELITTESERKLADSINKLNNNFLQLNNSKERYMMLYECSPIIDDFFEENMIMVDNDELKANRLNLLNNLAHLIKDYADFDKIIV